MPVVVTYCLAEHKCKKFPNSVLIYKGMGMKIYKRKIIALVNERIESVEWVVSNRLILRAYQEEFTEEGKILDSMICDILTGLKYCPYCGKELEKEIKT